MRYAMAYHSILKGRRTVFVTGMADIGQRRVGDDRPVCGKQFGDMEFGWVPFPEGQGVRWEGLLFGRSRY